MTAYEHIREQFNLARESEADLVKVDIEELASVLEELKRYKDVPTCGKCVLYGTDACPFSFADEDDTEICGEYLTEEEDG